MAKVKLNQLLERIQALEAGWQKDQDLDKNSALDWATIVDKFKELEQKISRIESLERNHGFLATEIKTLSARLSSLERALDNFKKRSLKRK